MAFLVFVDLVPEVDFEEPVPVECLDPVEEVDEAAVAVVRSPLIECGCIQSNPVDELGFLIATRKCLLV